MGQIVRRNKKGRPAKPDPAASDPPPGNDLRRSLRRRNVKYVFDLDDYFDEDDDEEQRRREKKLKHLLKLQNADTTATPQACRVDLAPASSSSSSSSDEDKPSKKRRIDEDMDDDVNGEDNYKDDEIWDRKPESRTESLHTGTPEIASTLPLPDKKTLELILDKLQKKDIYGVYAEPVDPDELPDYRDVIEHPMDFATVRNKLRNGSYAMFEQFESDVFLICSNAMQYNAPDTIYHKQARSIEELAKKKFEKIRLNAERIEKEIKTEQRIRAGSNSKKQIRKCVTRTVQETVCSEFSSGATLATTADIQIQNAPSALQVVGSEKLSGIDGLVEGNSLVNDNNVEKGEESLSGKGPPVRFGKKPSIQDENRRATYNMSPSHEQDTTESIFSTFEGEPKHLVPVGLYSDHSYARSLARFASTLGSVAWRVASKRIEQALPQGFKFGRGWVGEYEPLPTPVIILENCNVKEPPYLAKGLPAADSRKLGMTSTILVPSSESSGNDVPFMDQKFHGPIGIRPPPISDITVQPISSGNASELKASFFLSPKARPSSSPNFSPRHLTLQSRAFVAESDRKVPKQTELNGQPSLHKSAANSLGNRHILKSSEIEASRLVEFSSKKANISESGSFKQHDSNGAAFGGLHDGNVTGNNVDDNTMAILSSDLERQPSKYPRQGGQALTDPVQSMRKLSGKAQNQKKPATQPSVDSQVLPSAPSLRGSDSNNAATAAARAWMSVGAGGLRTVAANPNLNKNQVHGDSLYNSTRDIQLQESQFHRELPASRNVQLDNNSSPTHVFVPQGQIPMMVGNVMPFQNQRMAFPQFATADLSRFQMQSTWRNLSPQMLSRQKQESLPPDLNIGFQSSGSPGRPSSGVMVDSQQPDLALQL